MVVGGVDTVDNRRPGWSRRAARCVLPVCAGGANLVLGVDAPAVPTWTAQKAGSCPQLWGCHPQLSTVLCGELSGTAWRALHC